MYLAVFLNKDFDLKSLTTLGVLQSNIFGFLKVPDTQILNMYDKSLLN